MTVQLTPKDPIIILKFTPLLFFSKKKICGPVPIGISFLLFWSENSIGIFLSGKKVLQANLGGGGANRYIGEMIKKSSKFLDFYQKRHWKFSSFLPLIIIFWRVFSKLFLRSPFFTLKIRHFYRQVWNPSKIRHFYHWKSFFGSKTRRKGPTVKRIPVLRSQFFINFWSFLQLIMLFWL